MAHGKLIWSVNFTGSSFQNTDIQRVQHGIVDVLHTFQQHQMPATWMLPDPAGMERVSQNILQRDGQEVGLLGGSWTSGDRTVFARELGQRVESARRRGIAVATMAADRIERHLDLLVRHHISAVRVDSTQASISSRRFGIWQTSATDVVPGRRGLWGGRFSYRRLFANCVKNQQTIVLAVDGDRVVTDEKAFKVFHAVCQYAARQPQLVVPCLADVGRKMVSATATTPTRSILRAA